MLFKGEKVSKNMSNYRVFFSEREMAKWGRKFGYCVEEVFAVDTHVGELYETSVALGTHGSETASKYAVIYHTGYEVVTDPTDNKMKWLVKFDIISKTVDGKREYVKEGIQTHYEYFVERKSYFRDAVDKFIRDIIKDGHLSFFTRAEEEVKGLEASLGK